MKYCLIFSKLTKMNQELANIIKIYATGSHQELNNYLIGKSKDNLIGILVDLLTMYINDKNSSTIREFLTVTLAGYEHREEKIGYNGFKQDAYVSERTLKCEAKPKNINTIEFEKFKNKERKTRPSKLNGGGNFTDYTPERLEKDKKEGDLNMLVSGFIDGKLIYIIEFPFNCPSFIKNLEEKIRSWQNKLEGSLDKKGLFLRSADFDYRDYVSCTELKIVYLISKEELAKYKDFITRDFYKFLVENSERVYGH